MPASCAHLGCCGPRLKQVDGRDSAFVNPEPQPSRNTPPCAQELDAERQEVLNPVPAQAVALDSQTPSLGRQGKKSPRQPNDREGAGEASELQWFKQHKISSTDKVVSPVTPLGTLMILREAARRHEKKVAKARYGNISNVGRGCSGPGRIVHVV